MRKKLLLLGLLMAIVTMPALAQIENELDQSKSELVRKGRDYLLEKFLDRDYDKVKEIKDYLLGLETEDFLAFIPAEYWHILLWTREYDVLLAEFRQIDSAYITALDKKVMPYRGRLIDQLYRRSMEDEHQLRFYLQEAQLSQEDFDFLSLYLDWDLKPENQRGYLHYYGSLCLGDCYGDKEINELADKFLAQYPHSGYEWFVRHFIRVKYGKNDFGIGMGIDLCTGLSSAALPKPVGGFGVNMDVYYKKYILMLGMDMLYSRSRVDVPYTINSVPHIYPQGSEIDIIVLYADLSYPIIEKEKTRLAPYLGLGGIVENIPDDKEEGSTLKKLGNKYLSYNAGLCFDIKGRFLGDEAIWRIKYRFGMSFPDGSIATVNLISVGWNLDLRWPKRVY